MSERGMDSATRLVLRNVTRSYPSGSERLHVLRGVDLTLSAGEIVALVAPSGTGKSTLLHIAGLLDRPDSGDVIIAGHPAGTLPDAARTAIRRDAIGFVYQFHHLLGDFTALENIALPHMIAGTPRPAAMARLRPRRPRRSHPRQTLRRRKTTRRHRPRPGQPPRRPSRR